MSLLAYLSFRGGKGRRMTRRGRYRWSRGCTLRWRSRQCSQSSRPRSSHWHTHTDSCRSGYCRYLHSGKCLAVGDTRWHLLCSAGLWRGREVDRKRRKTMKQIMLIVIAACYQISQGVTLWVLGRKTKIKTHIWDFFNICFLKMCFSFTLPSVAMVGLVLYKLRQALGNWCMTVCFVNRKLGDAKCVSTDTPCVKYRPSYEETVPRNNRKCDIKADNMKACKFLSVITAPTFTHHCSNGTLSCSTEKVKT